MAQTPFVLHALSFFLGFYWLCYQKDIDVRVILRSLAGGVLISAAAVALFKMFTGGTLLSSLAVLPAAALLGATVLLWVQAHDQLSNDMSRDSIFFLTVSFVYFFSPWVASYRMIGLVAAPACLLVLGLCAYAKIDTRVRLGFIMWGALAALVMGVQQLWLAPESLLPAKKLFPSLSSGPLMYETALVAAGLVSLALNVFPFVEWVRKSLGDNDEMLDEAVSLKRTLCLTLLHAVPLIVNWKLQYFSYAAMLNYSLVWSPMLSTKIASAIFPETEDSTPPWLRLEEADANLPAGARPTAAAAPATRAR